MSQDKNNTTEVEMKGHSYDGISEYDNPLPGWWLWTFYITIIFAFIYFTHYQFGGGKTLQQEPSVAMAEIEKNQSHTETVLETEESLEKMMTPDSLSMGAKVFADKCAVCHGQELQGQIGPNLTDNYWIHGKGTRTDIIKVVREGVNDKGMPAWHGILKSNELVAVVGFIYSKKGSNPKNPKEPQGILIK